MWNGTSWQPLGAFSNDVLALAVFNSVLYAGGSFAEVHGNRISYWSGTKWNQVGAGIDDGVVYTLKTYGTSLAVGGTFTEIGQTTVNRIARWTGGSWASLGSGFDNGVYTLYSYGISLYAGGIFEHADNLPASKVAVYNGSGWSAITSGIGGINPVVKSIVSYGGRTVFAGKFSTAGGTTANNIAGWGPPLGIYPIEGPVPDEYSLQQNYPNPFNPLTKIRFAVPVSNDGLPEYVRLSVFNLLGGEVSVLVNERLKPGNYEVNFDGINLPSGTYFYRLVTPGFSMTKRMVLLK
jgi:hypothetical protein